MTIRVTALVISLSILLVTAPALGQDEARAEVFGGYQWFRASSGVPLSGVDHFSLNGWNASVSGYFNRYLGVTGDFSGSYGTPSIFVPTIGTFDVKTHVYTFMFGPVVRATNNSPIQPFAHVLFGGAHVGASVNIPVIIGASVSDSDTGFAWAAGGGADIKVTPRLAIRAAQFDFLQTHIGGDSQNNIRVSAGIVFRF